MIVLFTDFGLQGSYTGQMKAVLHQMVPGMPLIDLFADAPVGNPKASAYLLAAYAGWFAPGSVFLCVVDPGVGSTRPPIIVEAEGRWYVGPGNGLFELVQRRATSTFGWDIDWKPEHLSASFHGRDLFAPVAAMLARGEQPPGRPHQDDAHRRADWPDDLCEIVYIDHYGNAMTGLRAIMLPGNARLAVAGKTAWQELIAKLVKAGYLQPALCNDAVVIANAIARLKPDLRGGGEHGDPRPPNRLRHHGFSINRLALTRLKSRIPARRPCFRRRVRQRRLAYGSAARF